VDHVKRYRLHNELPPIPSLPTVIEDWLCNQPNMRMHSKEVKIVNRTLRQYLKGAEALAKAIAAGDKAYVPQQVAEARAEYCVKCVFNKKSGRHGRLERYTDKYVQSMVGDRKTSLDGGLFSCEVCSCPLRPKVHVSQKIVEESLTHKEKGIFKTPMFSTDGKKFYCWQFKSVTDEEDNA